MSEEVSRRHFLPHRAVYKPESFTTPIRPVFDASCKTGRVPSLNECLQKGPNLIELIPSILNRFRKNRIGVISDIRKAFQMIGIEEEDRKFLSFLWWKDQCQKSTKVVQHRRVVFGVNCSPFVLGAVIEFQLQHVNDERRVVAQKLLKSLYIGNCVTSVDYLQEYQEFKRQAILLMEEAKMDLRGWEYGTVESSGADQPISGGCRLDVDTSHSLEDVTFSVLGLKWDKVQDTLSIIVEPPDFNEVITKRKVLSHMHKLFDPVGFICPVLLQPKLLLQKTWKNKIGWDEPLSEDECVVFRRWCLELIQLRNVKIPRMVTGGVTSRQTWQFHVFSDASQEAYAAVVYLRTVNENGKVTVQLIQAKSRAAPQKTITIPRLELLGCNIAVRLTKSVLESMDSSGVPTLFWTDSTTALAWIRGNDEWGTFVGNRVREIIRLSSSDQWRYVPGRLNPADLPSRGCLALHILQSKWWEGPEWLREPQNRWPAEEPCQ